MPVDAGFSVGARPKPPIIVFLDSIQEILAYDVCRGSVSYRLFGHRPLNTAFEGALFRIPHVHIDAPLLGLPLDPQIVGELALGTLGTLALLEESAQHSLRIGS